MKEMRKGVSLTEWEGIARGSGAEDPGSAQRTARKSRVQPTALHSWLYLERDFDSVFILQG